ncbi:MULTISPECIES: 4a-hydroxytetrahydrobiopterin dehydratase [unclassified Neptuniibacter]|uniref:4a-hydroxytetrahydrobiopterin dehydratase n=1 Tax=unclassified Neptuniibacter TaxID=2630693 RepID=UPI000C542256|nr:MULTISPECIES: 4a-hydroxytetrahydrobiopterin dehydratase [unclassified Neptuniibacter]MAY41127.1 4a-hydroxytetrahydrobiopterin dehydratase [Oceanospirillaceae bacterium]
MSNNINKKLIGETCEACTSESSPLQDDEIIKLLNGIDTWEIQYQDSVPVLIKEYKFRNFVEALAFTNKVGEMAETMQHHPDITTKWGSVTLAWYTHAIGGLHRNDFRCAARSDALYS